MLFDISEIKLAWQFAREKSWDKVMGVVHSLWLRFITTPHDMYMWQLLEDIKDLLAENPDHPAIQTLVYEYLREVTLCIANKGIGRMRIHPGYMRDHMLTNWPSGNAPTPEEAEEIWPTKERRSERVPDWEEVQEDLQAVLYRYIRCKSDKMRAWCLGFDLHEHNLSRHYILNLNADLASQVGIQGIHENTMRDIVVYMIERSYYVVRGMDTNFEALNEFKFYKKELEKEGGPQWWYDLLWNVSGDGGEKPDWWPVDPEQQV